VHFFEFENDYQTYEDSHSFSELLFCYAGSLNVSAENYTGKLRKGELLIHRENEKHSLRTHKNRKTTVIIIGFSCESEKLHEFARAPVKLDEYETKMLARIVKEGRNVFLPPYDTPLYDMKKKKNQLYGSEQMMRSLLEIFLIELTRKHGYYNRYGEESALGAFVPSEVLTYVDAHYTEKITLDELSFLFNTNRTAFCKSFKELTGKTLVEYIAEKKIKRICHLLKNDKRSVTEISYELGFDNTAYLCRFFKKHTGMTPKQYRVKS
jgi:YesN/AraC family two-component response regulator